jgi:hypothetical protein
VSVDELGACAVRAHLDTIKARKFFALVNSGDTCQSTRPRHGEFVVGTTERAFEARIARQLRERDCGDGIRISAKVWKRFANGDMIA